MSQRRSEPRAVDVHPHKLVHPADWTDPLLWAGMFAMMAAVYVIALVVTWLLIAVASRPWKLKKCPHWSERARLTWPARKSAAGLSFLIVTPLAIVADGYGREIE